MKQEVFTMVLPLRKKTENGEFWKLNKNKKGRKYIFRIFLPFYYKLEKNHIEKKND